MGKPTADGNSPISVGVSFRRGGKLYYFAPNGVRVTPGDYVLAKTERGVDIGEVIVVKAELDPEEHGKPLKPLVRRAARDDIRREERLREREKEASAVCEQKIAEHGLPMKLIDADYTFDGQRLVFFFSSEGRVDFRALVRDLAETFHCRIELRQVGVRDEAKMVGGLGPCGRPLCCAQWLRSFAPVGIKVAKDQGMSLNPAKISGICDRLMCCLLYEKEVYEDLAARLPKVGDQVRGQGLTGRVRDVALLRERVTVDFRTEEAAETIEVSADDLRRSHGYWRLLASEAAEALTTPRKPEPASNVVVREPRGSRNREQVEAGRQRDAQEQQPRAQPESDEAKEQRKRPPPRRARGGGRAPDAKGEASQQPAKKDAPETPRDTPKARGDQDAARPQRATSGQEPARAETTGDKPKPRKWRRRRPRRSSSTTDKPNSE